MSVAELKPREGKKVPRSISVYTSVDIDIDVDDLHEQGFHHENECPAGVPFTPRSAEPAGGGLTSLRAALESLHRQAHGSGSIVLCHAEPCSSLSLDQLRGAA